VLKWRGKLKWEGDDSVDWTQPAAEPAQRVQEPTPLPLVNTKRKPHAGR